MLAIINGVINWAWQVVLNDEVIHNGTYMDTLKGGFHRIKLKNP